MIDVSDDWCDYCKATLGGTFRLRAIGFTEHDGKPAPLVRAWCRKCETDDQIDDEAQSVLYRAIASRAR